jgi:hypothetical protein
VLSDRQDAARYITDEQLEQHLTSTETPDFDFLWGIADMYKVSD